MATRSIKGDFSFLGVFSCVREGAEVRAAEFSLTAATCRPTCRIPNRPTPPNQPLFAANGDSVGDGSTSGILGGSVTLYTGGRRESRGGVGFGQAVMEAAQVLEKHSLGLQVHGRYGISVVKNNIGTARTTSAQSRRGSTSTRLAGSTRPSCDDRFTL